MEAESLPSTETLRGLFDVVTIGARRYIRHRRTGCLVGWYARDLDDLTPGDLVHAWRAWMAGTEQRVAAFGER